MKDIIKKNKFLYSFLLFLQHLLYSIYFTFFMNLFRIFKIKSNKIVVSSYFGKGYGDNSKYICDELLRRNEELDIVWLCNSVNDQSIPNQIRKVKYNSIRGLYELSTAKVWLDNCRKSYHIIKRKQQFYIQLWHGCLMLKKIEFDVQKQLGKYYTKNMIKDNKMIDLFISNSEYFTKRCRESFKYDGEILKCGEPRDDTLLKKHYIIEEQFRKQYKLEGKKIILYAPTFRMNYDKNPYDIDFEKIYNQLKAEYENLVFLVRLHPNVKTDRVDIEYNDHIINMSSYPNMQDLLAAADVLITDYSSVMFESMMIDKYVLLYANDLDYYNDDRGFYYELSELPFPLATNNNELYNLLKEIKNFNPKMYNEFKKTLDLYNDFDSSSTIADIIIKKTREEKKDV